MTGDNLPVEFYFCSTWFEIEENINNYVTVIQKK